MVEVEDGSLRMHLLKPTSKSELKTKDDKNDHNKLVKWITQGVFDALQKEYLRQLVFCVYSAPPDDDDVEVLFLFGRLSHASNSSWMVGNFCALPFMTCVLGGMQLG